MDQSPGPCALQQAALDSTIQVLLDFPDETPSKRDGISVSLERLHRLHGTSLLRSGWQLLLTDDSINASCYVTSCTILQRFFHRVSLKHANVWSVAMASTLLSAKLHDSVSVSVSSIVHVFSHLYRRRILLVGVQDGDRTQLTRNPSVVSILLPVTKIADDGPSSNHFYAPRPMSPMGPVFQEWAKAVLETENQILRELGFTLYWIPDQHAHKYLPYILRVLHSNVVSAQKEKVAQRAWNYCNDSYWLDLCTRYPPQVLACAAIHLSILDCANDKQEEDSREIESSPCESPWWERLIGSRRTVELSLVANALLGLRHSSEAQVAACCFVPSINGNSFNDPSSFVWNHFEQQLRSNQISGRSAVAQS